LNLHQVVRGLIGAINPEQLVAIQASIGNAEAADGSLTPVYATPGSITASIGGVVTGSIAGTTLTVTAVLQGSLQAGDAISGTDGTNAILPGTAVASQISGAAGGTGVYLLNQPTGTVGSCSITSASTVLNASAVAQGALQIGQTLADGGIALSPGTMVTGLLAGATGGPGLYSISQQQTVASEPMTTAVSILAQVQPLSGGDLRHVDAINLQGSHRAIYISGVLHGGVRVTLKGGDLVVLPDGSTWLVTQSIEPWYSTAGWVKSIITLQDGS
jgi:hypothetical protein